MKAILLAGALAAAGTAAVAQHHHPSAQGAPAAEAPHASHAPYAGLQQRRIKALSDEQLADLRAGRGMSLALPAELNGHPGPAHVLELAEPLALTQEQRRLTQQLFERMQAQARELGAQLIAAEERLDALFRAGRPDLAAVEAAAAQAAEVQGRLRAAHLAYHLAMPEVLDAAQVERYRQLRGYRPAR